jgi:hypothetical protein
MFTRPLPYDEAVAMLSARTIVGSSLRSVGWAQVQAELRMRAFFSAAVADLRFLDEAKSLLIAFLTAAEEATASGEDALVVASRADFVKRMQDLCAQWGIGDGTNEITDISSEKRLGLIYDIQIQSAHDYGRWLQGQDADILSVWPAQRFLRAERRAVPRPVHQRYVTESASGDPNPPGAIRLKSDTAFWLSLNQEADGGFGVPWGPWGFRSGCDVEDIDRETCEALPPTHYAHLAPGAPTPQPTAPNPGFNASLPAATRGLSPAEVSWVQQFAALWVGQ